MAARLLREGILDSEAVNALSLGAEVFYRRLMSVVDDFGRFDGRPSVLRVRLYPLRVDSVSEQDVVGWADECARAGLVARYTVAGKPYLLFHRLGPARAKESKWPEPLAHTIAPRQGNGHVTAQHAPESRCKQTPASVPYSDSDSDSGSDTHTDSGPPADVCASVADEYDLDDPLKIDQANRKRFEAAWQAAGLKPLPNGRLPLTLHRKLADAFRTPGWAEHLEAGLVTAGANPFYRDGLNRNSGPLDPFAVLNDLDLLRRLATTPARSPPPSPSAGGSVMDRYMAAKAQAEAAAEWRKDL